MAASDASQPAACPERRIAENGRPYTKTQFMHYYKSAGEFRWTEAEARGPPTDGSAAQPPAEDVFANQQHINQQEDAMGSTEGSPADRSAAIPAIAASPAITAVDAGHGTHLAAAQEKRLANNGQPYTRSEFLDWYGDAGERQWEEATQQEVAAGRSAAEGDAAQLPDVPSPWF